MKEIHVVCRRMFWERRCAVTTPVPQWVIQNKKISNYFVKSLISTVLDRSLSNFFFFLPNGVRSTNPLNEELWWGLLFVEFWCVFWYFGKSIVYIVLQKWLAFKYMSEKMPMIYFWPILYIYVIYFLNGH